MVNASQRSIPQQLPTETQTTPVSRKEVVQTPHARRMITEERARALTCKVREDPCHSKSSGRVDRSLLRNLPEKCFERLTWRICLLMHPENFTISTTTFGSKTFSTISARDIEHGTSRFIDFNHDAKDVTSMIGSADTHKKCMSASRISSTKLARRVRKPVSQCVSATFFRRKALHQRYLRDHRNKTLHDPNAPRPPRSLPQSVEQECAQSAQ